MNGRGIHKRPDFQGSDEEHLFFATSKRALWVALKHLCAKDTGEYDTALADGRWLSRLREELVNTQHC